jgi:threonine synthase
MDILKSSNVERILYDMFGDKRTKELMRDLDTKNVYELTQEELSTLQEVFAADFCNGEEGKKYIKDTFENGYLMDPHTATCFKAYETCAIKEYVTIAYSTAEWTKFSPTIANALTGELDARDEDALQAISQEARLPIPAMIAGLFRKEVVQKTVIEKEMIETEILKFL